MKYTVEKKTIEILNKQKVLPYTAKVNYSLGRKSFKKINANLHLRNKYIVIENENMCHILGKKTGGKLYNFV